MNSVPPSEPDVSVPVDEVHRSGIGSGHGRADVEQQVKGDSAVDQARDLFDAAVQAFQSSLALLRAELQLAKSSVSTLLLMSAVMIVLAVGAWLSVLALIAAAVHQVTGNWLVGIGMVALLNTAGIGWGYVAMKRCLHDMTLPRTRRMLSGLHATASKADEPAP